VLVETPTNSPTGMNLARSGVARLALGPTRDVTMIEADAEVIEIDELPQEQGDRFAERSGFDPCRLPLSYRWFRITPRPSRRGARSRSCPNAS